MVARDRRVEEMGEGGQEDFKKTIFLYIVLHNFWLMSFMRIKKNRKVKNNRTLKYFKKLSITE